MPTARTPEGYTSYMINKIPNELRERVRAKCAEARPPLSMRWVILDLLGQWAPPNREAKPEVTKSVTPEPIPWMRKPTSSKPKPQPPQIDAPKADAPDLGSAF